MVKMDTPQDVIRRYWRDKKRAQRASRKIVAFTPRITEFQLCSFCRKWHPTAAILRTGHYLRFTLDSFHSRSMIDDWLRETESARKLAAGPARQHQDLYVSRLEACAVTRMQIYKESRGVAEHNCKILFEDPLLRHNPPGLIHPADKLEGIDLEFPVRLDAKQQEELSEMKRCFRKKAEKGIDPVDAVNECMVEVHKQKDPNKELFTVGDLFGKSPKEIATMTKKEKNPSLTVGDLYGKTKKQILDEQRKNNI